MLAVLGFCPVAQHGEADGGKWCQTVAVAEREDTANAVTR